jgi:hypothetical protein
LISVGASFKTLPEDGATCTSDGAASGKLGINYLFN